MPDIPLEQMQGQATTILGRVSIVPKGKYENSTRYNRLDVVQHNGSGYIATHDNLQDIIPGESDDWMLLAERGAEGNPGPEGPEGPSGGAEVVAAKGTYVFSVVDGRLILSYSGDEVPNFSIDENDGHLYFEFD